MADWDEVNRRLTVKLVYYGPALSGKTTNLIQLHDALRPELKGEMMTLETQNDRTLFFDLLPLGFRTSTGLLVKFKLFTVPGQVVHDGTRKAVLSRADGVVFVADSQRAHGANNAEAFDNLVENAERVGLSFERLPLVVQFNKRDLPNVFSVEEIASRWSRAPWPLTYAAALGGEGVVETFECLLAEVYRRLDEEGQLAAHGLTPESFAAALKGNGRDV